MIYSWTVELAEHVDLGRRAVVVGIGSENDIPIAVEVVQLGSPEIGRVVGALWRLVQQLPLGIVPVGQDGTAQKRDIRGGRVREVVVVIVAEHPRVGADGVQNGVGEGGAAGVCGLPSSDQRRGAVERASVLGSHVAREERHEEEKNGHGNSPEKGGRGGRGGGALGRGHVALLSRAGRIPGYKPGSATAAEWLTGAGERSAANLRGRASTDLFTEMCTTAEGRRIASVTLPRLFCFKKQK